MVNEPGAHIRAIAEAAVREADGRYPRPVGVAVVVYSLEGELLHSSASNSPDRARMAEALQAVADHLDDKDKG